MPETKLNWETATVSDATLTVQLSGEVSKDFKHSFAETVRQLGHGSWGAVEVKKKEIRVKQVARGEEDKLRFFLESVVTQANATLAAKAQATAQKEASSEKEASSDEAESRELDGPDAEMTERFRAFSAGTAPADPSEGDEDSA